MLHEHDDLSLKPWHPNAKLSVAIHAHNPKGSRVETTASLGLLASSLAPDSVRDSALKN